MSEVKGKRGRQLDDSSSYALLERHFRVPIRLVEPREGYRIRPFSEGDSTRWTTIQNRVFETHKAQNFPSFYGANFSGEGIFFAQHGDDTVGIAAGILAQTPNGITFGAVDWVGVLAQHRRQNIATSLVTYVLEYLKSKGLPFASLATPADRVNGIGLYGKLGFELISTDRKELIDELQLIRAETIFAAGTHEAHSPAKAISGSQTGH